jgi:hypothetical protein
MEEAQRRGFWWHWQHTKHVVSAHCHHIFDLLFGPLTSTLIDAAPLPVMLPLPEGIYYGDITLFTYTMKRPRSPLATIRTGSVVTLYGGVPLGHEQGEVVSISSRETGIQAALCDVLRCIEAERAGWFPQEVSA